MGNIFSITEMYRVGLMFFIYGKKSYTRSEIQKLTQSTLILPVKTY